MARRRWTSVYAQSRRTGATNKSVNVVVRNGLLSIPHQLGNKPLDTFITNIFEHAYEHPWVHDLRLRWEISSWFIR